MTQEEKELLFKDLCGRLPYCLKFDAGTINPIHTLQTIYTDVETHVVEFMDEIGFSFEFDDIKPYLRPMSSMTTEEICKIENIIGDGFTYRDEMLSLNIEEIIRIPIYKMSNLMQFMYLRHLDFNNLIPMGLALPAPEGMYND